MVMMDTLNPGPIRWSKLPPPPGRTVKAAIHMYNNTRKTVEEEIEKIKASMPPSSGDTGGKAETPRKRGRKKQSDLAEVDEATEEPTKKKKTSMKSEMDDDEMERDGENTIKPEPYEEDEYDIEV